MTMVAESIAVGRNDRLFFSTMAIAAAVTVFVGFAPSYYLRPSTLPPLAPLVQLHGIVFTSWFLLFATQTRLLPRGVSTFTAGSESLGLWLAASSSSSARWSR